MPGPLESGGVAVASAGTAVPLSSTPLKVFSVSILARQVDGTTNTGNVFLGDSSVDNTNPDILPGETVEVPGTRQSGHSLEFDLSQIFVDADTNDDGVSFWYTPA